MNERVLFFKCDGVNVSGEVQFMSERVVIIDQYQFISNEIDKLLSLKENWDGQGAIPILKEVGETSKKLFTVIDFIDGISDIFPNPHGTITIEWTNNQKEKLSLEIGVNNYSYFMKFLDKPPKLVDGENILMDTKTITQDLGELFSEEILNFIL